MLRFVLLKAEEDCGRVAPALLRFALVEALGVRPMLGTRTRESPPSPETWEADVGRCWLLRRLFPMVLSALGDVLTFPLDPVREGIPSTPRCVLDEIRCKSFLATCGECVLELPALTCLFALPDLRR